MKLAGITKYWILFIPELKFFRFPVSFFHGLVHNFYMEEWSGNMMVARPPFLIELVKG